MLKASLELNRALEKFVQVSDSLGETADISECEISTEDLIKASIKFLKAYELCIRIDESLRDIARHEGTRGIIDGIERAKLLLNEIADVVGSFNKKERTIFLSYAGSDFKKSKRHLEGFLNQRPAGRIWHEDNIRHVVKDLMDALGEFRKSAAYSMFMTISPDERALNIDKVKC